MRLTWHHPSPGSVLSQYLWTTCIVLCRHTPGDPAVSADADLGTRDQLLHIKPRGSLLPLWLWLTWTWVTHALPRETGLILSRLKCPFFFLNWYYLPYFQVWSLLQPVIYAVQSDFFFNFFFNICGESKFSKKPFTQGWMKYFSPLFL